eukprot:jgi/Galph1/4403/GphlegSOOS_G3101.1
MQVKFPSSYCKDCGDPLKFCKCQSVEIDPLSSDRSPRQESSQHSQDQDHQKVKSFYAVDKSLLTMAKDEQDNPAEKRAAEVLVPKENDFSTAREVFRQLETSSKYLDSVNAEKSTLVEKPSGQSSETIENISDNVYQVFGVRLGKKNIENKNENHSEDCPLSGDEENQSINSSKEVQTFAANKEKKSAVSSAISEKLHLFDNVNKEDLCPPKKVERRRQTTETCFICKRRVHPLEKFMGSNGHLYHRNCLSCVSCQCSLAWDTVNYLADSILCNKCFFIDRISVILSKNFKLSFRNFIAVALQVIVPLLFTLFIFAAKLSYTRNSIFKIYVSPDKDPGMHSMQTIPRCMPFRTPKCYSIAFVPPIGKGVNASSGQSKTLNVTHWVYQIAAANNIPTTELISFDNSTLLNEFLYQNENTTQAAYIFEQENLDDIASGNVSFIVQYNQTKQCDFPSASFCYYQEEYLVPNMILAMNEYLMKNLTGKDVQLNFSRSIFPHPAISGQLNAFREYGPFLLFGAYMLNFVFFLGELVNEKELKLRESMKMAGLGQAMYLSTWFITFLVSMTLTTFLLIAFGAAFQFNFYLTTSFGDYFLTFWIFSMALICWTFLFSTFTPKSSQVNYVGFVFFIVGYLIASSSPYVYGTDSSGKPYLKSSLLFLRYLFALIPSTMFYKGVYDMATFAISGHGLTWSERSTYTTTFPLTTCWVWMIWTSIAVMALAVYLDNVLPNEFGSSLPWYYPFSKYYWFGSRIAAKRRKQQIASSTEDIDGEVSSSSIPTSVTGNEVSSKEVRTQHSDVEASFEETYFAVSGDGDEEVNAFSERPSSEIALTRLLNGETEDSDVVAEERAIESGRIRSTAVVIINKLYKEFRTGFRKKFVAVNGVSLAIDEGHLFCLLGHNGAGKSTIFNMLTGVLKPSSGDALIYSHSVTNEQSEIRHIMGVCPQHDILWKRLTGAEHIELFATLKNICRSKRKEEIDRRLEQVGLLSVRNKFASQYSGGMQRRLSVAIALTGEPKIVFLDEPTTGMDPVSRRHAWEMIEAAKKGRVIVLTTHSMEEADVLGDRIGIMSKGRLRCLGTPLHLKNKFGTGYRLVVLCQDANIVRNFVKRNLSEVEEVDMNMTPTNAIVLTFVLPRTASEKLSNFFSSLERQKETLSIIDFSISMSSLEEVFLKVVAKSDLEEQDGQNIQGGSSRVKKWLSKLRFC